MSIITNLEKQIESADAAIQAIEKDLKGGKEDFSLSLTLDSLKQHRDELHSQLRDEKTIRNFEIIELRLRGKSVNNGSIPLGIVGDLSHAWGNAIIAGANQMKLGLKAKRKVPKEIVDTLDLRLAGISSGSSRLFITGKSSPDLFGNSLLQSTLQEAFELLSSDSGEKLTETVGRLGKRTADSIDQFLKTITSHDLEVDISWNSPSDKSYMWEGKTDKILQLSSSLESLVEGEPEEINFNGELITISMKGTFEISDDAGIAYRGTFPSELLKEMKEFHIGQRCKGVLAKRTMINRITGYEKPFFEIKTIR